jgi:putative ABC transport system permease protein
MNWMGEGPVACQVVGVVGNARVDSVSEESRATMYLPFSQFARIPWMTRMCPVVRTELDPQSLVRTLSRLIADKDRDVPLDPLVTMEERVGDRLQGRRATAATLALFSAAALGLASLGLYGVLSFMVKQRTREIGVRTALGARTGQVMWEVVRQGLMLAVIGAGFGVLASMGMGRILESQLYQVSAVDPVSIALGALASATAVLLASLIPAGQAARVDPVVALRNE